MAPDESALVTSSSKGLGAAVSRVLAARGHHVYITAHRDRTAAQETTAEIRSLGGRAEVVPLDVTDEHSVRDAFAVIEASGQRLVVLVNNAVTEVAKDVTEVAKDIEQASFAEWRGVLSTKLDGAWLCTRYALPLLRESHSTNIVSGGSHLA